MNIIPKNKAQLCKDPPEPELKKQDPSKKPWSQKVHPKGKEIRKSKKTTVIVQLSGLHFKVSHGSQSTKSSTRNTQQQTGKAK